MIDISEIRPIFIPVKNGAGQTVLLHKKLKTTYHFDQTQIEVMVKRAKRWLRSAKSSDFPPRHIDMALAVFQGADSQGFTRCTGGVA